MAIAEWESYVLSGRFKTKRQRKRLRIEGRDKQLVHLYNELLEVKKQQRNLGLAELHPPVQKGWKRYFVLREDVERSKDAEFFRTMLERINTVTYSHRKDFKYKRRRGGKRVDVDRLQFLRGFYGYEWTKLKLNEREMSYFRLTWEFVGNSTSTRLKYVFTEPWRFVLRVRPNMITHVKIIDPELMRRERELDNYLERNNLYPRISKQLHGWHKYRWHYGGKPLDRHVLKYEFMDLMKTIKNKDNE